MNAELLSATIAGSALTAVSSEHIRQFRLRRKARQEAETTEKGIERAIYTLAKKNYIVYYPLQSVSENSRGNTLYSHVLVGMQVPGYDEHSLRVPMDEARLHMHWDLGNPSSILESSINLTKTAAQDEAKDANLHPGFLKYSPSEHRGVFFHFFPGEEWVESVSKGLRQNQQTVPTVAELLAQITRPISRDSLMDLEFAASGGI